MNNDVEVAIIGAGFSGLAAAIRLLNENRQSLLIFERAATVGGTWRDNVYPGCACDIPSHLYSFSFAPNPNWSRTFSPQPEILNYLKNCVEKYDLTPYLRYNTEIVHYEFDPQTGRWHLFDRANNRYSARVVISATGPLNRPNFPKINGLTNFEGRAFHSSMWDNTYDLRNKRVAVIGTGASAIQFVPQIAEQVAQLTVFQRTAPWITPRLDRASSVFEQKLFKALPFTQKLYRSGQYWYRELVGLSFVGNEFMNKFATTQALEHLHDSVADAELRQKLTPNYKLGCKRVLVSDDYYPALSRPNVSLITDPIQEVKAHSIVTKDGSEHPIDAIIFGTGFVAAEIILDAKIVGLNGAELMEEWKKTGPEAYYGLTVSGFPNLLFLVGPNTGLGHNSIIHMIESQVNYVVEYLQILDKKGEKEFLDLKPQVQRQFNETIQQELKSTVWASGCQSWYQDSKGKITSLWPGLTRRYRQETRQAKAEDYAGV